MSDDARLQQAEAKFQEVHRTDPRGLAATYHETLASWVDRLAPGASLELRVAARCQHLRRWANPRSSYPEGVAGYKRWRSELSRTHAAEAGAILKEVGFDDVSIARVGELLTKRKLKSDPDTQSLEDAICLTFMELELEPFAAKHPDDKVVDILKKTWAKMSSTGHEAATKLARGLPLRLTELIARATS